MGGHRVVLLYTVQLTESSHITRLNERTEMNELCRNMNMNMNDKELCE